MIDAGVIEAPNPVEVSSIPDGPHLLVQWSSPWDEFRTAIRPALTRSMPALAGEAHTGLFPYRGLLASWALEALILLAIIVLPGKLGSMRSYEPLQAPKYDIIYFSGDELPRTRDVGGAHSGRSGRAGGQQAHHHSQTIRVARGDSLREKVVDAPKLKLPRSDSAVANLLAYKAVPGPAPAEGLRPSQRTSPIAPTVMAPAPSAADIKRDKMRTAPTLAAKIVAPAPVSTQRDVPQNHLPGSQTVAVIPPPVSAPERATTLNPRLTLPASAVVAPPPTQIARERSLGPGSGEGDLRTQIVPPPAQLSGALAEHRTVSGLGDSKAVAPSVQLEAKGLSNRTVNGLGGSAAVVPPAPAVSGNAVGGQGSGRRGAGLGGEMDAGSALAPPVAAGGAAGSGVVVSSQPGTKTGIPNSGGTGALAMSPSGGVKPGLGGSGGGGGIGRGNGPGSGLAGEGSGAGREGAGRGSDPNAHGGISPYPGPGGTGTESGGKPAMPGVTVSGGSPNTVTLPSFASSGTQPTDPARSSSGLDSRGPGITVVATSRSGGAFNFYGALKGDKVYTIYIETALGTAVMQFADPTSASHPYAEDLTAPQPMRAEVPASTHRSRLVIACILDRSGMLRGAKVLEPGSTEMTAKVLAALPSWKFRPVLRRAQPIEVNAILGFNIDTR